MMPGSLHDVPALHLPNVWVGVSFLQYSGPTTGGGAPLHPQQSLSERQISPVGLQPEGGSQIVLPPVAPNGPQACEQQLMSHDVPPMPVPQSWPSTVQLPAPVAFTTSHMPK